MEKIYNLEIDSLHFTTLASTVDIPEGEKIAKALYNSLRKSNKIIPTIGARVCLVISDDMTHRDILWMQNT